MTGTSVYNLYTLAQGPSAHQAEEIDPESRAIGELMTRDPETIELESSLAQAFHRMMVSDLRYLPLVDDEGRPVSIVTSRDLIDFLSARVAG